MSKLEEYERLAAAGVPTPRTIRLTRGLVLDPSAWGEYVVVKPARGSFGRDVRLVRAEDVPSRGETAADPKGGGTIVQSFVEHVDSAGRPTTHRVLTCFGKPLYAIRSSWQEARPPAAEVAAQGGLLAANAGEKDRVREILDDPAIVALAESAARAVPEVPVLGVDVIRETGTGRLYVLELNAAGTVWHLSSATAEARYTARFRKKLYAQFGALDRVADLLIEKTRAEAS
jgi:glutathione synthase/RimK-type ligase-like ATP-grasp enzyme